MLKCIVQIRSSCFAEVRDFILQMLCIDPSRRLTAKKAEMLHCHTVYWNSKHGVLVVFSCHFWQALEHNWVKAADFQSAESEDEDDDDVDHSVDRSDRSDSSDLVIDELDDEGGPPPGCMSKSQAAVPAQLAGCWLESLVSIALIHLEKHR